MFSVRDPIGLPRGTAVQVLWISGRVYKIGMTRQPTAIKVCSGFVIFPVSRSRSNLFLIRRSLFLPTRRETSFSTSLQYVSIDAFLFLGGDKDAFTSKKECVWSSRKWSWVGAYFHPTVQQPLVSPLGPQYLE